MRMILAIIVINIGICLMFVCICNEVTDKDIHEAVDKGVQCMDGLNKHLKVAGCCGRCEECARKILRQAMSQKYYSSEMALLPT